jgi:hypothetical protein
MDYRRWIAYALLALLGFYLLVKLIPYLICGLACVGAWHLYKSHHRS